VSALQSDSLLSVKRSFWKKINAKEYKTREKVRKIDVAKKSMFVRAAIILFHIAEAFRYLSSYIIDAQVIKVIRYCI
jgi:hypothetical protein